MSAPTERLKVELMRFPGVYASSRRPYATARFLARRPHDGDYAAFGLFPRSEGLFLDVGANAGMSSMSLRLYQRRAEIFAVEPNPYHEADLRWTGRLVGRFRYGIFAAGEAPGRFPLHIPFYRGVPITAEASLQRSAVAESPSLRATLGARMDSSAFRIEEIEVEVRRLDDLDLHPAFVKLDVQGHEHAALQGMAGTLERDAPPALIEGPSPETMALMSDLGYQPYRYDRAARRLVALSGTPTNVMFVKGEPPAGGRGGGG
jgi:FkbM family methyltransferase